MKTHIRCGQLFSGADTQATANQTLVFEDGRIEYVGPTDRAPTPAADDKVVDHSDAFVMPGLIDVHVHLSYGEARTQEDIDLFASTEFRALRGLEAAQRVLKAGFTSIVDPTTTGHVSLAIRDAIRAKLFTGPRVTTSGRALTSRQGLDDWYPTWIGVPETSIGVLVTNPFEGIEEIRRQVKDGVDIIKIAMDGDSMNPTTGLVAGFNQDEITTMVREIHRLGKKCVVHSRGAEGTLYAARAGVDVIFHASWMDERGLEAVLENDCVLCPTLNLIVNSIEFTRPSDGCYPTLPDAHKRELEAASQNLSRAHKAGARFMVGSEAGFAITPYGEWNAKELENLVKYVGLTPGEALYSATAINSTFLREDGQVGVLEPGRRADILVIKANPLNNIAVLQDKTNIKELYLDGEIVDRTENKARRRLPSEFSYSLWGQVYTQERIAALDGRRPGDGNVRVARAR